jgi:uncharacterized membrane protein HdeD (DUF308 family)
VWVIRGIVAVFFGVIALIYPAPSLLLGLLLFGAYLQLDGLAALALATSSGLHERTVWPLAALGILGLLGGMLIMLWPDFNGRVLMLVLGVCCLLRGGLELLHVLRSRLWLRHLWPLAVSGVASLSFGVLLISRPTLSTSTLAFAFAGYVTLAGACLISSALRMRGLEPNVLTSDAQPNT